MSEMNPCKSCGGTDMVVFGHLGADKPARYVNCRGCWAESGYSDTRDGAIANWNAMNPSKPKINQTKEG